MNTSRGFTLIEMLVVVGLISLLLLVSISLFFSSLRGNQKISSELVVKQNGDYAISQMARLIRNARSATCSTTTSQDDTLTVVGNDGGTTVLKPVNSADSGPPIFHIASNAGALTQRGQNVMSVTSMAFTCSTQADGVPTLVTINFTIESGTVGDRDYVNLPFSTSVSLRTY